jgi:general secretion pathway protein E
MEGKETPQRLDDTIRKALDQRASDIHFEPTTAGYTVRLRVDGLLQTLAQYDATTGRSLVNRLMVLAQLLTYRLDVPQEGRLTHSARDLRLAVIPSLHGLRAVVRLPAELTAPLALDQLGLHPTIVQHLHDFARGDFGMLICCGPAGSGKTTTLYALLRHMAQVNAGQSIITLEDPVERGIDGITQIEVSPFGQLTYERSLRSILRQDPQVLMLGEIRDPQTASLAVQASLSGHRLVCTLHAASPAGAIARLTEMGVEPYQVASALWGVLSLRLVRRTTASGYSGRLPLGEWSSVHTPLRQAILRKEGPDELSAAIRSQPDYLPMTQSARIALDQHLTDSVELERAGFAL